MNSLWQNFVDSHSEWEIVTVYPLILMLTAYWGWGLLHLYVDIYKPKFLYQYKIQKTEKAQLKMDMLQKLFVNVILAQIFIFIPFAIMLGKIPSYFPGFGIRVDRDLPSLTEVVCDFVCYLLIEELVFYYSHRLLHHPSIYAYIHKQHHNFTAPIALAAIYAHPVEVIFSNLVPMLMGPVLRKSHTVTFVLWSVLGTMATMTHHCGYRFPWNLPFDEQPNFHDYHHEYFNRGNYGVLGILDWVHGTDSHFRAAIADAKSKSS